MDDRIFRLMKLTKNTSPQLLAVQLWRLEIQIAMTDVALRMARLAVRCGR